MKFQMNLNVLKTESFNGKKDPSKSFYNVSLVNDDILFPFKFVGAEAYNVCVKAKYLGLVSATLDISPSGIKDNQGNDLYSVKLVSCQEVK